MFKIWNVEDWSNKDCVTFTRMARYCATNLINESYSHISRRMFAWWKNKFSKSDDWNCCSVIFEGWLSFVDLFCHTWRLMKFCWFYLLYIRSFVDLFYNIWIFFCHIWFFLSYIRIDEGLLICSFVQMLICSTFVQ